MLRLHIDRVETVFASPGSLLQSTLVAMLKHLPISFAQTDVQQRVEDALLLYSVDRSPFRHRDFLGWMGYVAAPLTMEDVPAATRLERTGDGTLIVAAEVLDLADAFAIKRVNQVEMSLVDLELLRVTDPSLD